MPPVGSPGLPFTSTLPPENLPNKADQNEYELLCLNNTRKPVDAFKDCHLARIPSHAVVARSVDGKEDLIWELLQKAQVSIPLPPFQEGPLCLLAFGVGRFLPFPIPCCPRRPSAASLHEGLTNSGNRLTQLALDSRSNKALSPALPMNGQGFKGWSRSRGRMRQILRTLRSLDPSNFLRNKPQLSSCHRDGAGPCTGGSEPRLPLQGHPPAPDTVFQHCVFAFLSSYH